MSENTKLPVLYGHPEIINLDGYNVTKYSRLPNLIEWARQYALEAIKSVCQRRKGLVAAGWSNNEGDSWGGAHPADSEFVEGLKVGDEYELLASVNAWTERFRVVKAPDDTGDDYEVELVSIRTV